MPATFLDPHTDWRARLAHVVQTVREMSTQTDPQEMVRAYGSRMRTLIPMDRHISLSRRGLEHPQVRITRSDLWKEPLDPWKNPDKLPVHRGGLLSELIWGEEPRVIGDIRIEDDDPAAEYFAGQRSLIAIPHYHEGASLNMVVHMRRQPNAFSPEDLPDLVMMSNLFGRATGNLVLARQVKEAYEALDRELRTVAEIQRSLLPPQIPHIATLDLATHYQTSQRAGGDYYDLFPLPSGRWGIFIADVSGHGTPAAVVMAITHSIAHSFPGPPHPPSAMLDYLNHKLVERYTGESGTFVTAFYGIYDPQKRTISYASAGHNPPRLKLADGAMASLSAVGGLPLGIFPNQQYEEFTFQLSPGDLILFYTDGITEAFNPAGLMYGIERLDVALAPPISRASDALQAVLRSVNAFAENFPPKDDQTLLAALVR